MSTTRTIAGENAHQARKAHHAALWEAMCAPAQPVAFPVFIHGTRNTYAKWDRCVEHVHVVASSHDTFGGLVDAMRAADKAHPATHWYAIDSNGAYVPTDSGWHLSPEGIAVCECALCGTVSHKDAECCEFEIPF